MASEATIFRYMSAHVRTNSKQDISGWSVDQIMDAFLMLPRPQVTVDQFAQAIGDDTGQKLPGIPVRGDFIEVLQAGMGAKKPAPAEVVPDAIPEADRRTA